MGGRRSLALTRFLRRVIAGKFGDLGKLLGFGRNILGGRGGILRKISEGKKLKGGKRFPRKRMGPAGGEAQCFELWALIPALIPQQNGHFGPSARPTTATNSQGCFVDGKLC